jgi:hypothetical protein
VIGRIKFLVISIKTIKFIRGAGVPMGTRWIIIFLNELIQPNSIIIIHSVIAAGNEIEIWAVCVNKNGIMAIKLEIINTIKIDIIRWILPFFKLFFIKIIISFFVLFFF